MRVRHVRQRGAALVIVLVLMALMASLLSLMAACGAHRYRAEQGERIRNVARAVCESAAAYARLHLDQWSRTPPVEPIELEVSELLPAKTAGSATIRIEIINDARICRVSAHVERSIYAASDAIDIRMK